MADVTSDRAIGRAWVAGQVVLIAALVLLPGGDDWPKPLAVRAFANVVAFAGFAVVIVAAMRLGPALTPTPVPRRGGTLARSGLYRFVRHPIYSGVLLIVLGIVVRSASWLHVAIGAVTVVFFDRKAAWEERRLREQYPDYDEYAAVTPRFVPRPR